MVKLIIIFSYILPMLLSTAIVTLVERKWLANTQRRNGPIIIGIYGILQPFADALKLIVKENVLPSYSNKWIFVLSPIISLLFSIINFAIIPYINKNSILDMNLSVIYNIVLSSLGVYGILLSGWSSNSSYSLIGSIRSSAQIISYELVIITQVIIVIILSESLNYNEILNIQKNIGYVITLIPIFVLYFISVLGETNRAPIDLPEAESELVAGFFTEYSSVPFVIFFLAEYISILFISYFTVILWFGNVYIYKNIIGIWIVIIIIVIFIVIRSTIPRLRFDNLIKLCWKSLLPLSFGIYIWVFSVNYII